MSDYSTIKPAFEGMQGNMVPATFISRTAEADVTGAVPLVRGTLTRSAKKATSGVGFLGIHCPTSLVRDGDKDSSIRIMTQGVVWVKVAAAVVEGASVGYSSTGAWATAAQTTYPNQIVDATYEAAGDTGELVPVRMMGTEINVITGS